jgi:hypothetical protein
VRCVEQLGAELGEPLTEDGLMKMMALLGWNHGHSSVEMGKGLNKYPPVEWSSIWGPLQFLRKIRRGRRYWHQWSESFIRSANRSFQLFEPD